MSFTVPPFLQPGASVRIVAPASPLPSRRQFLAGLAWLGSRYRLRMSADVLAREGYLAGSDDLRLDALQRALGEEGTQAIVLARGGYGITRLLERLDLGPLVRAPKWLVGFSDGTALHAAAQAAGLCSLHASNVNGLGALHAGDRDAWIRALEGVGAAGFRHHDLRGDRVTAVEGPAFGGNLSLVQALAAQGRLSVPPGAIWFVEDVSERPYRLDRMATSLRSHLRSAGAIVLGEFFGCGPGLDGVTAETALASAWGDLGVPIVHGAPFGHGVRNAPVVLGATTRVEIDSTGRALVAQVVSSSTISRRSSSSTS